MSRSYRGPSRITNHAAKQRDLGLDLGGAIFGCINDTYKECTTGLIFGLPNSNWSWVQHVRTGMPIFLFNYNDKKMHGIFRAVTPGTMMINPQGWTGYTGTARTKYPAQVQVEWFERCRPILDRDFKRAMEGAFWSEKQFTYQLTREEARSLCMLFSRSATKRLYEEQEPARPVPRAVRQNTQTAGEPRAPPSSDPGPDLPAAPEPTEGPFSKRPSPSSSTGSSDLRRSGNDAGNGARNTSVNGRGPKADAASDPHDSHGQTAQPDSAIDQFAPTRKAYTSSAPNSSPPPYNPLTNTAWHSSPGAVHASSAEQHTQSPNLDSTGAKQRSIPPYNPPTNAWHSPNPAHASSANDAAAEPSLQSGYPSEEAADAPFPSLPTTSTAAAAAASPHTAAANTASHAVDAHNADQWPRYNAIPGWQDRTDTKSPGTAAGGALGLAQSPAAVRENGHVGPSSDGALAVSEGAGGQDQMTDEQAGQQPGQLDPSNANAQQETAGQQRSDFPEPAGLAAKASDAHQQPAEEEDVHMLGTTPPEAPGIQPAAAAISQLTSRQQDASIYLLGGGTCNKESMWLDTVDVFSPSTQACTPAPPLPKPCAYGSAVTIGQRLFYVGGGNGEDWFSSMLRLSLDEGSWEAMAGMHVGRGSLFTAMQGYLLWAIGGRNKNGFHHTTECYQPAQDKWLYGPSTATKRFAAAGGVLHNAVYVTGGFDGVSYQSSVERLDAREGRWSAAAPMLTRRGSHACAVLEGQLYAVGGWAAQNPLRECEVYDPRTDRWREIAPMHEARAYFAGVACQGALYAMGGLSPTHGAGPSYKTTLETYDAKQDSWQVVAPPVGYLAERAFMSACVVTQS